MDQVVNGDTWYEVGRGKTYTPTADDVGHVLKLECMAVDSSTGLGIAAASTVLTSRVIPAPSPTPRRLIPVNSLDGPAGLEMEGRIAAPGTFTVLSYNVLADLYATSDMYSYCPPWALSWAYRRQNLLREIVQYRADILCLQEVLSYS
jgi:CCR4-NOT transcription complex subunit 6